MDKIFVDSAVVLAKINLEGVKTCQLVEELKRREGVRTQIAEPYKDLTALINGPATVLVITD